jgi:hypothetical protein
LDLLGVGVVGLRSGFTTHHRAKCRFKAFRESEAGLSLHSFDSLFDPTIRMDPESECALGHAPSTLQTGC